MKKTTAMIAAFAVALLTAGLAGCGAEQYKPKTEGSEQLQQKVKQGQPLYTPPAGAPMGGGATAPGGGGPPR